MAAMTPAQYRDDKYERAYRLRAAIHEFVSKNNGRTMLDVFAEFPLIPRETLRKAVYVMRDDGDVRYESSGKKPGKVWAIGTTVRPAQVSRMRSRNATSFGSKERELVVDVDHDTMDCVLQVHGARTVNYGSKRKTPIPGMGGGQGALRSRVYVGGTFGAYD